MYVSYVKTSRHFEQWWKKYVDSVRNPYVRQHLIPGHFYNPTNQTLKKGVARNPTNRFLVRDCLLRVLVGDFSQVPQH